jgi:hypothetical protein
MDFSFRRKPVSDDVKIAEGIVTQIADAIGPLNLSYNALKQYPSLDELTGHYPALQRAADKLAEVCHQLRPLHPQPSETQMSKTNIPRTEGLVDNDFHRPTEIGGRDRQPAPDSGQQFVNPDGTLGNEWPNRGAGNDFVPPSSGGGSE